MRKWKNEKLSVPRSDLDANNIKQAEFQFKCCILLRFYDYFHHFCIWAPELTWIREQIKLVIFGEVSMHLTGQERRTC